MIAHILGYIGSSMTFIFIPILLMLRSNSNLILFRSSKYSQNKLIIIQSLLFSYLSIAAIDIQKIFPVEGLCISLTMVLIAIVLLWYFVDKRLNIITIVSLGFYILSALGSCLADYSLKVIEGIPFL